MDNFKLNIYTPSGVVVNGIACDQMTVPTSRGIINILKGHTHIITELGTGIVKAKLQNGQDRNFTVAGGLCKVLGQNITILAKTAESPDAIDKERAQSALSKAESRLKNPSTSVDIIKFQRKLERAKNRLKVANLK